MLLLLLPLLNLFFLVNPIELVVLVITPNKFVGVVWTFVIFVVLLVLSSSRSSSSSLSSLSSLSSSSSSSHLRLVSLRQSQLIFELISVGFRQMEIVNCFVSFVFDVEFLLFQLQQSIFQRVLLLGDVRFLLEKLEKMYYNVDSADSDASELDILGHFGNIWKTF